MSIRRKPSQVDDFIYHGGQESKLTHKRVTERLRDKKQQKLNSSKQSTIVSEKLGETAKKATTTDKKVSKTSDSKNLISKEKAPTQKISKVAKKKSKIGPYSGVILFAAGAALAIRYIMLGK